MGRGRGQEGYGCPVRETLGRMVIPSGVAGREGGGTKAGECMGRGGGVRKGMSVQ
jgi:hypothetical protein